MTYYCRIAFFFLSKTTEHGIDKPTVLNQRYITNLFECCGSVILRSRRGSRDLQLHDNDGSRLTTRGAGEGVHRRGDLCTFGHNSLLAPAKRLHRGTSAVTERKDKEGRIDIFNMLTFQPVARCWLLQYCRLPRRINCWAAGRAIDSSELSVRCRPWLTGAR
jgi:hypothetical protein